MGMAVLTGHIVFSMDFVVKGKGLGGSTPQLQKKNEEENGNH
jgi:hypothetical protein